MSLDYIGYLTIGIASIFLLVIASIVIKGVFKEYLQYRNRIREAWKKRKV